jgi:hypothetical protein
MKTMIAILAAALLCSCATAPTPEPLSNLPANYKTVALEAVKQSLRDPDSVKVLRLSSLAPTPVGPRNAGGVDGPVGATCVFVECNAKNGFGGYTGITTVGVFFKDGKVVDVG